MKFEEMLRKERRQGHSEGYESGREAGIAEGREESEARMLALVTKMVQSGEEALLSKLSDRSFLEEMYHKYKL